MTPPAHQLTLPAILPPEPEPVPFSVEPVRPMAGPIAERVAKELERKFAD